MNRLKIISLALVALGSACTMPMPAPTDEGTDALDAFVTTESGNTDRVDVPVNDVPNTDMPNVADVPNLIMDTGVCPIGTMPCELGGCVNSQTDNSHCGACGIVCPMGRSCQAGMCTCHIGTTMCAGSCVNTQTDAANCGACGIGCPMNQMCVAGVCRLGCPLPNSPCGAGAMMTCLSLQTDVSNCGMCGNACTVVNATPNCTAGICGVAMCNTGFGNCDNTAANGCEVITTSDVANCGACGNACPAVANGSAVCAMSACSATCNAGFERVGAACIAMGAFPRPIAPLSLGDASLRRPTLRWQLPAGTDGADVELCRDRACTMVIERIRAVGTSVRPALALPANSVVFWRLRATVGAATAMSFSPTWLFHVPATDNSANVDTSSNAHLDLNGDGFDDVVVGASWASPGGLQNAGTASVFHGSAMGVPMIPTRVLEGIFAGGSFGNSVAGAGDVNGDGFGDLVVGARLASPGGRALAGTASVFHGSAMGVPKIPTRVLEGVLAHDQFGISVASGGDVNGDGFGDLVVGAAVASPGGRGRVGTASVFHGSAMGVPMLPIRTLEGVLANDAFGYSVASTGDVNGDGFGDMVVGALLASPGGRMNVGTASVFHGSAIGVPMIPTRVLEGVLTLDQFGNSVASAGDVNGDGFGDLVVGSFAADPGGRNNAGTASVFHGSAMGVPAIPSRVLEGGLPSDLLGNSVASARDVNGDGFGDLVVGAYYAGPAGSALAGTASVFHGSAMGVPTIAIRVLEGVAAGAQFGRSVASAGDVNGDGFADLVVGANYARPGGRMEAGTATLFQGSAGGIAIFPTRVLEGPVVGDQFGISVANVVMRLRPRRGRGRAG